MQRKIETKTRGELVIEHVVWNAAAGAALAVMILLLLCSVQWLDRVLVSIFRCMLISSVVESSDFIPSPKRREPLRPAGREGFSSRIWAVLRYALGTSISLLESPSDLRRVDEQPGSSVFTAMTHFQSTPAESLP